MKASSKNWDLLQCDNEIDAAWQCAECIALQLRLELGRKERVSLFLSGGKSPAAVFDRLADTDLDWQRVDVFLVDERVAPENPLDLNATMVQQHLLRNHAQYARFYPLLTASSLHASMQEATAQTASLQQPDIVLLGMGIDGHTASLFPDAPEFFDAMESQDHYVSVHPASAPYPRISMSGSWLRQARSLILFIPGEQKWQAFRHFVLEENALSPLSSLLQRHPAVTIIATGGESL